VLANTIIIKQTDEVVLLDLIGMLVEYGTPRFIQGGVDLTQTCDARDNFIFRFDFY
jgi:hypothetical protein